MGSPCEMVKNQGFCRDNDSKLKGRQLANMNSNANAHSNWVLGIVDGCCKTCENGKTPGNSMKLYGRKLFSGYYRRTTTTTRRGYRRRTTTTTRSRTTRP